MPQLAYNQLGIPAQPGMPFGNEISARDVVSATAAQVIPFGVLCELNASNLAVPVQDANTNSQLSGTVTVTNGSATITFSGAQTLPAGTGLMFSAQPGVMYYLAAAVAASVTGTLTNKFSGLTSAAGTTVTFFTPKTLGVSLFGAFAVENQYNVFSVPPGVGSVAAGWFKGMEVPFMRRGRIWVAGDAGGTSLATGPINVWHSSTGANPQGVFTFTSAQQTVGAEIDQAPGCQVYNLGTTNVSYATSFTDPFGNTFKVYPVEVNL